MPEWFPVEKMDFDTAEKLIEYKKRKHSSNSANQNQQEKRPNLSGSESGD